MTCSLGYQASEIMRHLEGRPLPQHPKIISHGVPQTVYRRKEQGKSLVHAHFVNLKGKTIIFYRNLVPCLIIIKFLKVIHLS